MDVEDLAALAEIADDVEDLFRRLVEHLRHCALAEVQAVIRTLGDRDEPLQPIDRSEHRLDAAPAAPARHSRVLRVARQPYFVFARDRNHALEEVRDSLPIRVGVDAARQGERRFLLCVGVDEGAVPGAAAPRRRTGPWDADDGQVVLDRWDAGASGVPDHLADVVDLPVARRILREQDGRILAPGDFGRAERQRHHGERDAERLDSFPETAESLDRPRAIHLRRRQPAADMGDAETGEDAKDGVRVAVLGPRFHPRRPPSAPRDGWLRGDFGRHEALRDGVGRHAASDQTDELPAVHLKPHTARRWASSTASFASARPAPVAWR